MVIFYADLSHDDSAIRYTVSPQICVTEYHTETRSTNPQRILRFADTLKTHLRASVPNAHDIVMHGIILLTNCTEIVDAFITVSIGGVLGGASPAHTGVT